MFKFQIWGMTDKKLKVKIREKDHTFLLRPLFLQMYKKREIAPNHIAKKHTFALPDHKNETFFSCSFCTPEFFILLRANKLRVVISSLIH